MILAAAFAEVPCDFLKNLKIVEKMTDKKSPRALAGASSLYLRADLFELPSAKRVLLHEIGHLVDLGRLRSKTFSQKSAFLDGSTPVFADDPSAQFYAISFLENEKWRPETKVSDFVSRYAATDPFEDFAESFLFYRENGATFREMAAKNPKLQKKYNFLKNKVFGGREFVGKKVAIKSGEIWDATKIL